jgi:hypothetical protein
VLCVLVLVVVFRFFFVVILVSTSTSIHRMLGLVLLEGLLAASSVYTIGDAAFGHSIEKRFQFALLFLLLGCWSDLAQAFIAVSVAANDNPLLAGKTAILETFPRRVQWEISSFARLSVVFHAHVVD